MPRTIPILGWPDVRDVPVWIYALVEPTTGVVRYVGKSSAPRERLFSHCAASGAAYLREWVSDLAKAGQRPLVVILYEVAPGEDADEWERKFIRMHSWTSRSLLNGHGRIGLPSKRPKYAWEKVKDPRRPSAARTALIRWIREGHCGRSPIAIADAIGTQVVTLNAWLIGKSVPRTRFREPLEKVTGGSVRADQWPPVWPYGYPFAPGSRAA